MSVQIAGKAARNKQTLSSRSLQENQSERHTIWVDKSADGYGRQRNCSLKMSMSFSLKSWICEVIDKGELVLQVEVRLLISWPWEEPGLSRWTKQYHRVHRCGNRQRYSEPKKHFWRCWLWKWYKEPEAKECSRLPEAGKGKETLSLKPPEET